MNSMPRILVVIDEFHVMSQQAYDNDIYMKKLENNLAEGRSSGFIFLFCDQSISVGLSGLSKKGREQMALRMAMSNSKDEISETLDIKLTDSDTLLQTGEVLRRIMNRSRDQDGLEVREVGLERDKVIYIKNNEIEGVIDKANALYERKLSPFVIDGRERKKINWNDAMEYEADVNKDMLDMMFLHLGKPTSFSNCFAVPLKRNSGENIMYFNGNSKRRKTILLNTIISVMMKGRDDIYIVTDYNEELYREVKCDIQKLMEQYSGIHICDSLKMIHDVVLKLKDKVEERRKKPSVKNILVCWLGLENILQEFSYYNKMTYETRKKNIREREIFNLYSNISATLNELEGNGEWDSPIIDNNEQRLKHESTYSEEIIYDLSQLINEIIHEGAARGIFQFVFISSISNIISRRLGEIRLSDFKHRMSGYLGRKECDEYYENGRFMSGLEQEEDEDIECYFDGTKRRFFTPYLIDKIL